VALEHQDVDLKLHVMIHWPRCYNGIPWMNCEDEENELPEEVKQAGPPPHVDKVNAWKGSWKALETLFNDEESPVVSIGVSNFHLQELQVLAELATVQPHMVETNMWSLLYDPLLVDYCHKRNIHLTAFHLMDGVIRNAESAPYAYHHILVVANELTKDMRAKGILTDKEEIAAAQVVLAWLVQHSVSVIPRTTDLIHLKENSAVSLAKIPPMTDEQVQKVAHSVEALISGEDVKEDAFLKLTFHAKSKDIYLYWHDKEYGGEIQVALIKKGGSFEESSHPGHIFRIYETEDKQNMEVFTVEGNYGDHRHIEL
jgi:diketogulonate reductase-like aldo/keto reductase